MVYTMMNETEKEWMLLCMLAKIRYKTLYLMSQNRLHAEIYAIYILDDLKDHITSERLQRNC